MLKIVKKRWFFISSVIIGIVIGIWHLGLAMSAIFVFREGEPIWSWIAIMCGPLSTLPAVIVSLFKKKIGGIWLIAGGFSSIIAMIIMEGPNMEIMIPFFYMFSAPMLVLSIVFLTVTSRSSRDSDVIMN